MIKLEKTEVMGWEHAIRGMRNPMNSWDKSDSHDAVYSIGPNDLKLMKSLVKAGSDHRKFMRMITVYVDITAPLYWWKEFDTYKVGTVANSCSTMHKIHDKEFTLDDFSHEHLLASDDEINCMDMYDLPETLRLRRIPSREMMLTLVDLLNFSRRNYLILDKQLVFDMEPEEHKKLIDLKKKYWWQMIQLLPSSYNQKRTIMFNYEVLSNIYPARKNHKLDEWHHFCDWIKELPYSEIIIKE